MDYSEFYLNEEKPNIKLFTRLWEVEQASHLICLVHGQGEHSGRYQHVGDYFATRGMSVWAIDLVGHGKSSGKRGHVARLEEYTRNLHRLATEAEARFPNLARIIYGHSMGGNVVANYLLTHPNHGFQACVLTSPWLKLAFEPPKFKVMLAGMVRNILPAYTEQNTLDGKGLSRDPAVANRYVSDTLVHGDISAGAFFALTQGGDFVLKNAQLLQLPTLLMHGTADAITSCQASQAFASKNAEFVDFIPWEAHLHELHNELDYEEKLDRVTEWVQKLGV